jgi:Obg family GTPase CgtA-like protein
VNDIKEAFREAGINVRFISAATGEGAAALMQEAWQKLQSMTIPEAKGEEPKKVFRPQPKGTGLTIHKEGDVFVVEVPGLSRMVSDTGEVTPELQLHVQRQLTRIGLGRALGRAGALPGDKVRCGIVEWEWMP